LGQIYPMEKGRSTMAALHWLTGINSSSSYSNTIDISSLATHVSILCGVGCSGACFRTCWCLGCICGEPQQCVKDWLQPHDWLMCINVTFMFVCRNTWPMAGSAPPSSGDFSLGAWCLQFRVCLVISYKCSWCRRGCPNPLKKECLS
jgi:hypothetical protein